MLLPNQVWDGIIQLATKNIETLRDQDTVKQLMNILKTNVSACKSIGHPFVIQLGRIYLDMVNVYKVLSENISSAVSSHGEAVTRQPLIRSMRGVKKEALNLITTWVNKSNDPKLVSLEWDELFFVGITRNEASLFFCLSTFNSFAVVSQKGFSLYHISDTLFQNQIFACSVVLPSMPLMFTF